MKCLKKIFNLDPQFLCFLLVLTTIVYIFSWGGEFLSDDIMGIQLNEHMGNFTLQLKTLNINNIYNSFIYNTFGVKPFWFHLSSTIFHLLGIIAVYVFILKLTSSLWITRLTTLLFAIHPIETESIAWISGLSYVLYTFLAVVSLAYHLLAFEEEKQSYKYLLIANILFVFSLSSSEKAVILPGILLAIVVFFIRPITKTLFIKIIPAITISCIYILLRLSDVSSRIEYVNPSYGGNPTTFNPVLQIPIAIYSYIKLLLIPIGLTLYHEFTSFSQSEYYLAIAVTLITILVIIITGYIGFKKDSLLLKLIPFGLLFLIFSLGLTLLPINIAWVVAERYVHLGSIGFFLSLSAAIYVVVEKFKLNKESFYQWLFIVITPVLAILTIRRNLQWRTQDTLWPATVKVSPNSPLAWNNMGDYYGRHGDIKNSISAFENARKLRPGYADATHNLANVYMQIGESTKAAELFLEATKYNPNLYQSYRSIGQIALAQKKYETAIEFFTKAAEINPDPFNEYLLLYLSYRYTNSAAAATSLAQAEKLVNNNPQRLQAIQQIQQPTSN